MEQDVDLFAKLAAFSAVNAYQGGYTQEKFNARVKRDAPSFKRVHPEIYNAFLGRQYAGVEKWNDWMLPAFTYAAALVLTQDTVFEDGWEAEVNQREAMVAHHAATSAILGRNANPTFFIAPDLLEAARRSNLPDEIDWRVLKLPFEAATFMFPRGAVIIRGKEIPYITYSRKPEQVAMPSRDSTLNYGRQNFSIQTITLPDFQSHDYSTTQVLTAELAREQINRLNQKILLGVAPPITFATLEAHNELLQILFNLIFVMDARPELIDRQRYLKTEKYKKRELRQVWQPNVVGARYRIQTRGAAQGGTHASPRLHWRRGHYRHQNIGKRTVTCACGHTENFHASGRIVVAGEPEMPKRCFAPNCGCAVYEKMVSYESTKRIWIEPIQVNLPKLAVEGGAE